MAVIIAVTSGIIFGCSLLIVHQIDPDYTFARFVRAYALYKKRYIIDGFGFGWNDSLYGAVQVLRLMFGLLPTYSPVASRAVSALGAMSLLGFVWLAVGGRLRRGEAFFAAAAFCVLFTPVYAQYHILIFAGVLAVLTLESAQGARRPSLAWAWPGLVLFIATGCMADLAPTPGLALLLMLSVAFFILRLHAEEGGDMITVVSLLVLAPLGGPYANGVLIAGLLATAMLALFVRGARRPVGTAGPVVARVQWRIQPAVRAYRG
jgi:hypothetical protein